MDILPKYQRSPLHPHKHNRLSFNCKIEGNTVPAHSSSQSGHYSRFTCDIYVEFVLLQVQQALSRVMCGLYCADSKSLDRFGMECGQPSLQSTASIAFLYYKSCYIIVLRFQELYRYVQQNTEMTSHHAFFNCKLVAQALRL